MNVSYRDKEDLVALTGQRQSCGEKSVATIMYLMALQVLTQANIVYVVSNGLHFI